MWNLGFSMICISNWKFILQIGRRNSYSPLVWMNHSDKKMNPRNYTLQQVNIALKIKNKPKEKYLREKSWKNVWNMEVYYMNGCILDIVIFLAKKQPFMKKSFIFQTFFQLFSHGYFSFGLFLIFNAIFTCWSM